MPFSTQKTPTPQEKDETELTNIDYLYDFNSIFANPKQDAFYASPYDKAPVQSKGRQPLKKAAGGLLNSGSEVEVVGSIIGKPAEAVTEADIDFVADLIAQQMVLSTPEMPYDNTNTVDAGNTGMVNPASNGVTVNQNQSNIRKAAQGGLLDRNDLLLKLLGEN
jgi:hypothetical protein